MGSESVEIYFITPALAIGPHRKATIFGYETVSTAKEAVAVIRDRKKDAMLPPDSWDEAREVLRGLGLDEKTIEDRIHFARTGTLLQA